MGRARLFLLCVPVLGVCELGLAAYDARRAPGADDYRALHALVEPLKAAGQVIVVAPRWAEPLVRQALGDAWMPIRDLARPDTSGYAHALEIDVLGAEASELVGWPTRRELDRGRFRIRLRDNPEPVTVRYVFPDHARPPELSVFERYSKTEHACAFTDHARLSAGGLHGHIAFPRERFACGGGEEYFAGVTLIDDQDYRPRRCLYAHPGHSGPLLLRFADVPLGTSIHGYTGASYFIYRDGLGAPVTLTARVDGQEVGRTLHRDERGWQAFRFDTARFSGKSANVEFEVRSDDPRDRQFCFYADTR